MDINNPQKVFYAFLVLLPYIFGWSGADGVLAPMEKNEQLALYSTVQDFVGKDWNGSELYPDPCGWTPIQGVSCDFFNGFWHVTDLNLGQVYDNSLNCSSTAEFGYHLFELKYLRKLTFTDCFLSSHQKPVKIPESRWERLANSLEHLEFRSNPGLTGGIPTTLGCLTKLESLVLIENALTGELPHEIGNFVKLKRLVLSGNRFTGQIPDCLGGLNQLLIFDGSRNFLRGELPPSIGGLTSLLKLDLSSNLLGGRLPREIGQLTSVTLVDLSYNNFSGGSTGPRTGDLMEIQWKNLHNLEVLVLSDTGVTGNLPNSMTEMKKLRFLGLNNNKLTGTVPPAFENLPCISALYLDGNNFTGKLEFSELFYVKIGSHFRASDNVHLCCPLELSSRHSPAGVRPCE